MDEPDPPDRGFRCAGCSPRVRRPRTAHANGAQRIDVEVGQTVACDVGIAMGLLCDDVSIVHAELRSETAESNVLRVTGLWSGDTLCRAGIVPGRPMFVFEIHVTARRSGPP